jgi:nucleotide-binding universal stress UspA family protein
MSTRFLSEAFDRYLETLGNAERVDLPWDGAGRLRREVQEAKRRMLEQIDATERRVLAAADGHSPPLLPPPQRILVAFDGSDPATWAIGVAGGMAARGGAELIVLTVVDPAVTAAPELAAVADDVRVAMRQRAETLTDVAVSLAPPGVPVERVMREGAAGDEIVAVAREWQADLVVLGTRGRGRLATFLLGGTAEHVIRRAHCPVVTVGHDPAALNGSTAHPGADTCVTSAR